MREATLPFLTPQSRRIVGAMRVSFLLLLVPQVALSQGAVLGTVYDSLAHAPLRDADVWVRGSDRHAQTNGSGRFRLDSIAPGHYTLFVSHPGLDSAGLFTLAVPRHHRCGLRPERRHAVALHAVAAPLRAGADDALRQRADLRLRPGRQDAGTSRRGGRVAAMAA